MKFMICEGPAENAIKPAPRYAEIVAACRAVGMDIEDNDYEKIDGGMGI